MMSSSYLWQTTPQNVRLPSLLCIFLGKMGKPNSALSKSHQTFFQAHDQKNPCPAGDGQCLGEHPSEHQQNCSTPTQPTSMVGLVKSLKTKRKSALAQKLLRNFMFHYCFASQSSPFYFDAPGLCKWQCHKMKHSSENYAKDQFCLMIPSVLIAASHENLVFVLSLIESFHDLYIWRHCSDDLSEINIYVFLAQLCQCSCDFRKKKEGEKG